ncbi:MAG: hypothetical protein M1834_001554 [Cirrosporium novae-zelandiae]|nr:MAG: hypothetical protein M1834_004071 [Cirrosporium novae-zelandiae]KAI9735539.1 MAG: hypothetical protein M1834_001554 [Cirrosporium novae-zelandiae]
MALVDASSNVASATAPAAASKPKRVRTGCLTCRERHLKCDEAQPECQNCRKSNRECKRGVRLNFIDTQVQNPPIIIPSLDWRIEFRDESRDIASEYKGGLGRYANIAAIECQSMNMPQYGFTNTNVAPPPIPQHSLPPIHPMLQDFSEQSQMALPQHLREIQHQQAPSNGDSAYSSQMLDPSSRSSFSNPEQPLTPLSTRRDYLATQEETLFMQVFVEEVGVWMDSMDSDKHFSRLLPFHALDNSMLLNAFLACGARHLSLVNSLYTEEKALNYYDTATRTLLQSLQNPNRDAVICATTAVILNVYEVMSERPLQRMNHIAGARALIKECGWNARSTGVGAACFWLNVGLELLSCLHFNWQVAWDPDEWGVDLDWGRETESGKEELWCHRMLYLLGKVANFRATVPRLHESNHAAVQSRFNNRCNEWKGLKEWCDSWNNCIPRTMHPVAYLHTNQTASKSSFPEIWLIKRATIVARLFFHTAMCLLSQINPMESVCVEEMQEMRIVHSRTICGIVAHVKDRGVASVALRTLAIAAECLNTRREQEEILNIFARIRKETGWRISFLNKELKEKWGWVEDTSIQQQPVPTANMRTTSHLNSVYSQNPSISPPVSSISFQKQRTNNPLLSTATDFSAPSHPYQNHYVAPNQQPPVQSQYSLNY